MLDVDRWNDDRLDDLKGEVDDLQSRLGELPEKVARVDERTKAMIEAQRATNDSVRELRRELARRFDQVDQDHRNAAKALATATGGVVVAPEKGRWEKFKDAMAMWSPIIVALIAAAVALSQTGGGP